MDEPREVTSVLKVARTIADLYGSDSIRAADLAEATQYKSQARDSIRAAQLMEASQDKALRGAKLEAGEP